MGTFWSWFIRPFAELAAGLAIVFGILLIFALAFWVEAWANRRKRNEATRRP